MTTSRNKVMISLLTRARLLVEIEQEEFICHALDHVAGSSEEGLVTEMQTYILGQLRYGEHRKGTLGGWLYVALYNEVDADYFWQVCPDPVRTELLTLARLAWIDKMIHNLKENGALP